MGQTVVMAKRAAQVSEPPAMADSSESASTVRANHEKREASGEAYTDAARRVLATDVGVATFAESNVQLVGAEGVIERMPVDQMTLCHNAAMRLAARASTIGKRISFVASW